MGKSYKEQKKNRDMDIDDRPRKRDTSYNHRRNKAFNNALKSNNLAEILKYSEEE